jgi:hypothetical protein
LYISFFVLRREESIFVLRGEERSTHLGQEWRMGFLPYKTLTEKRGN